LLVVLALLGLAGCKVGASAGSDPGGQTSGGQTDNGAIPANSITGSVTFNGAPLPGATITLFLANSNIVVQTATTDASGN
jgi:hypothetical protein